MKTLLRNIVAVTALTSALLGWAEAPAGYYNSLNGKSGADLKTAVYNVAHNFTHPSTDADYASTYTGLSRTFQKTDYMPDSKRWWDMYGNIPLYGPSFSGLNREHSFPKSWWGGLTNVPAYIDLNHLYPSEAKANMAKSNYPLGTVDMNYTPSFNNGITKVGYPVSGQGGGAKYVFEPDDEFKGDFARTYFYMATIYQTGLKWKYTYMVNQNTYPTLNSWSVDLLLKWHRGDPVSEKETLRNDAVYKVQNNRNPFIDQPELAEYIWGNKKGNVYHVGSGGTSGVPTLTSPVQDMELEFGEVALGKSVQTKLFFKGTDLTAPLSMTVYTGDKDYFTIPSRQIAANLVTTDDGYWLPVTYTPTELGMHSSRLLINGGGIPGSLGVALRGECLPVPTLSACTALAATNVTDDSYTANWTSPTSEVVDYYVVTRTMYPKAGGVKTEVIEAEDNSVDIDDCAANNSETYSVKSARLGYYSPESNVVTVQLGGIEGVEVDQALVVMSFEGSLRILCSVPHTGLRVIDAAGRVIMALPAVSNNTDIELPTGVYFVVTDQCHRPVRAIVR